MVAHAVPDLRLLLLARAVCLRGRLWRCVAREAWLRGCCVGGCGGVLCSPGGLLRALRACVCPGVVCHVSRGCGAARAGVHQPGVCLLALLLGLVQRGCAGCVVFVVGSLGFACQVCRRVGVRQRAWARVVSRAGV